jgi:non-ribosomal peptide synthetase component F
MTKVEPLRVLQFASVSFDMAMQEIVTTLSMGGCVCVPSESERTSEGIIKAINRMKVTWLFLTPTFASLIDPSSVPTLRTLVFGGEAAVPALFTHFPPHVRLLQVYGMFFTFQHLMGSHA